MWTVYLFGEDRTSTKLATFESRRAAEKWANEYEDWEMLDDGQYLVIQSCDGGYFAGY